MQRSVNCQHVSSAKPVLADMPLVLGIEDRKRAGWAPDFKGVVYGKVGYGDQLRVVISMNGAVIKKYSVPLQQSQAAPLPPPNAQYAQWTLIDNESSIAQAGTFLITFKYFDFGSEQETVLGQKTLRIAKGSIDRPQYLAIYDDLLLANWISMDEMTLTLHFWVSHDMRRLFIDHPTWIAKVFVDGKPITEPENNRFPCSERSECNLFQYEIHAHGPNQKSVESASDLACLAVGTPFSLSYFSDTLLNHSGVWQVKVYAGSDFVREFRFTVNDGAIVPDAEQAPSLTPPLQLGPRGFFVQTYFPNPDTFDNRFDVAAAKAGCFYGRPWKSDSVANMLKSLPSMK